MTPGAVDAVIVVAMDDEAAPFLERASAVSETTIVGNARSRRITVDGRELLLVLSGIGLVNAASAATSALVGLGDGPLPLVVSAGTAGGLAPEIRVGEVVVGTEYINIDADARVFGYVLGQVPGMPPAYEGFESALQSRPTTGILPTGETFDVVQGLVVSSYSFVSEDRVPVILSQFTSALATDMESVAIAQTSHVFGAPFVSVRGISDLCGPAANDDHLTHVDDASERSAVTVLELLARLVPVA
jgi:adenosylhomocysteine nucleosidase